MLRPSGSFFDPVLKLWNEPQRLTRWNRVQGGIWIRFERFFGSSTGVYRYENRIVLSILF